ncbi:MAG: hypothetical protein E7294_10830 [Lachnospiraceae bacterium]|nr:hypothetical protein [Lachnospiraceae bacterium]
MIVEDGFEKNLLDKIKESDGNALIPREYLIKCKNEGMKKEDMLKKLEKMRYENEEKVEDFLLDLMDFVEGFCNRDLTIF